MTAVANVEREAEAQGGPDEAELLDVLYEVLAQGAQPKGSPTVEAVERFLHEHARSRKPRAEILSFFEAHGLPTDASAYGTDPALTELAAGFLRDRTPSSANFALDAEAALPGPSESGPIRRMDVSTAEVTGERTSPRAVAQQVRLAVTPAARSWLPAVSLACAAVLAVTAFLSFRHAHELEQKLNEARLQQRTTDNALTAIEQRAEALRGSLAQSEHARQALSGRFDDFIVRESQARAAESIALERILGKRFEKMRDQALADALISDTP